MARIGELGSHSPERGDAITRPERAAEAPIRLSRWLVSFASGADWYPVGEFLALDAAGAIERSIAVFGSGSGYRAEEIPWDAAPLPRMNLPAPHRAR